jgi:hypothetical protein
MRPVDSGPAGSCCGPHIASVGIAMRFASVAKKARVSLGDQFEVFVSRQMKSGRLLAERLLMRAVTRCMPATARFSTRDGSGTAPLETRDS